MSATASVGFRDVSMLSAFANIVKIRDLRIRVLITIALLFVARLGVFIPIPGVDAEALKKMMDQITGGQGAIARLMGVAALFTGGSMRTGGIFYLGIMPYISSSIIMQLLTAVWPRLQALAREGESGRKKINQYTRLGTVLICIVQGGMVAGAISSPGGMGGSGASLVLESYRSWFPLFAIVSITAGTLFLMWLGDQIDEFGIGNGTSLIITIGIISQFPNAIVEIWTKAKPDLSASQDGNLGPDRLLLLVALFFAMIVAMVALTQAQRRIPMSNMRRRGEAFSSRNYLPLQVNMAGVIAIIFAQSIMILPGFLHEFAARGDRMPWAASILYYFTMWHFWYVATYMLLIVFFCYFYTAITFNPNEQAENFQSHGLFIPGMRPGQPTAEYLEYVMNRITLFGAAAVAVVAVFPQIITNMLDVTTMVGQFFGGTGLLIIVGVALDVVRRIESHVMMQYYEGFLQRGRIRGRGR